MSEVPAIHAIVEQVKGIREQRETLDIEEDMLWKHVFDIADDIEGPEKPYRYTHRELLLTIGRVMAENSPRLDEEKLKEILTDEQWIICTKQERVFDIERLTIAVAKGVISKEDVESATEQKPPTARKHFKPANKEERQKALRGS